VAGYAGAVGAYALRADARWPPTASAQHAPQEVREAWELTHAGGTRVERLLRSLVPDWRPLPGRCRNRSRPKCSSLMAATYQAARGAGQLGDPGRLDRRPIGRWLPLSGQAPHAGGRWGFRLVFVFLAARHYDEAEERGGRPAPRPGAAKHRANGGRSAGDVVVGPV